MADQPFFPPRPQTPQAMLHRLPDKPTDSSEFSTTPSKYIILIMGSTGVAGKVQIATSVSKALSCPLYQGDSLHESSAKAASVGTSKRPGAATRYQRMWLSKMTRTGLLFPDESRPANEGFSGFGGASTSTSRRGSASSIASTASDAAGSTTSSMSHSVGWANATYVNKPPTTVFAAVSENDRLQQSNPAILVLTHTELEKWHKLAIRKTVGEYRIGVIFVPLPEYYDELRLVWVTRSRLGAKEKRHPGGGNRFED
ncbi:uncharacterized protein BCR38DRAFT_478958 [Pseudomassariella vexata]|uniref:Uncharacterized protein n=1 Tax=Pseudomassariella vexata TaxID=1141098 RepID=A0A1Y2D9Q2_9PEZI|nr:uncharacterized protein BCR38DRAFT_478958 [Pseudomassariella vexata]ORY55856.1 hypothetical protein BCR38DRAFT_478958 [Pseudomassariella vexata]